MLKELSKTPPLLALPWEAATPDWKKLLAEEVMTGGVVLEQLIHFTQNSSVIPEKFFEPTPASPPPLSALTPPPPTQAVGSQARVMHCGLWPWPLRVDGMV